MRSPTVLILLKWPTVQWGITVLAAIMCITTLPTRTFAQKCTFTGTISLKDGDSYDYRLLLDLSGKYLKGESATSQGNLTVRTKLKGYVTADKKVMAYKETVTIGALPDSMDVCYVSALLRWKVKKDKVYLSGLFAGKDKQEAVCSEGKINLSTTLEGCPYFAASTQEKKATVTAVDTTTDGFTKITDGTDRRIHWQTKLCTLEVWDGGLLDDDVVTITHNDQPLLTNLHLTADKKKVVFPLGAGDNTITILAVDEGASPPNTAQMVLYDGDRYYKVEAFNKKGKTARVVLTR